LWAVLIKHILGVNYKKRVFTEEPFYSHSFLSLYDHVFMLAVSLKVTMKVGIGKVKCEEKLQKNFVFILKTF
jgi:hypothetical protein